MSASCSDRRGRPDQRGFTLTELVAVVVLISALAAVALPRLGSALSWRDEARRDAVQVALRTAHKSAMAHRRLVCVSVAAQGLTLSMARSNPATACQVAWPDVQGAAVHAAPNGGGGTLAATPTSTLYFQPDGRITQDAAGTQAARWTLTLSGADAPSPVLVHGGTGHVE
jgi:MSHA pilin protein MshC